MTRNVDHVEMPSHRFMQLARSIEEQVAVLDVLWGREEGLPSGFDPMRSHMQVAQIAVNRALEILKEIDDRLHRWLYAEDGVDQ